MLRPAILWNDQRTAAQCAEIADYLRDKEIEVTVDSATWIDRRRRKTPWEIEGMERAQRAAETAMLTAARMLYEAEPTAQVDLEAGGGVAVGRWVGKSERIDCLAGLDRGHDVRSRLALHERFDRELDVFGRIGADRGPGGHYSRRERHPEHSPYNTLCDVEWRLGPVGATPNFGGDVLVRAAALQGVGGALLTPGSLAIISATLNICASGTPQASVT